MAHKKIIVSIIFFVFINISLLSQNTVELSEQTLQESQLEGLDIPFIDLNVRGAQNGTEVALSVQLILLLAVISLSPAILILMTSFLRIMIVLSFIQQALGTQQIPPRQILTGLAIFLTLFVMWPVVQEINEKAIRPLSDGTLSFSEAYPEFVSPLRVFMYRQMQNNPNNLRLFMRMSGLDAPQTLADVPSYVLVPAFVLHELVVAFKMSILLFIPFVIIDIVVASVTMSMGMILLPPVLVSLPIKLALFVLVNGWELIMQQLVLSFGGR